MNSRPRRVPWLTLSLALAPIQLACGGDDSASGGSSGGNGGAAGSAATGGNGGAAGDLSGGAAGNPSGGAAGNLSGGAAGNGGGAAGNSGGGAGGNGAAGTGGEAGAGSYPAWPTFGGVSKHSTPIHTGMSAPGYLQWTLDPRSAAPHFDDGRIPTEVARVSDASAFGLPGGAGFRLQYSKVSPWNADGSLAMVFYAAGGPTRGALLDGESFAFRSLQSDVFPVGRWSMTRPTVWIQPESDSVPRFEQVDVSTGQVSVFKDFTTDGYVDRVDSSLFGGEGNQSNDDRVWVFNLQRQNGDWELVIWDSVSDQITGRIPVFGPLGGGTAVDWWTASQGGGFVVTQSVSSWASNGQTIPRGNNVWSLSGEYLRTNDTSLGHLDTCLDEDGQDVLGYIGSKYGSNDKIVQSWRLDGSDSESRAHLEDGYVGWAYHLNCRNTSRPGLMMVASAPARPTSNYNVFPMWNHLFAVQMGGSNQPGVIGNSHHSDGGESENEYYRSPFGPVNRDFTAVMFSADWDAASGDPIMLYVARPKR